MPLFILLYFYEPTSRRPYHEGVYLTFWAFLVRYIFLKYTMISIFSSNVRSPNFKISRDINVCFIGVSHYKSFQDSTSRRNYGHIRLFGVSYNIKTYITPRKGVTTDRYAFSSYRKPFPESQ